MKWRRVSAAFVLLISSFLQPTAVATDERPDVGHDEDIHPNALMESNGDVLDLDFQTRRDVPDTNMEGNWDTSKDNYEDGDWHPPSSPLEKHSDLLPNNNRTGSSTQCGEYSSQLMSNGQCRLVATLPPVPVGPSQKRCPDMFRCTDDISHWLHENQNRKEQLDELSETMSELQEELRNHRHRVKALDMQVCHALPGRVERNPRSTSKTCFVSYKTAFIMSMFASWDMQR